MFKTILSLLTVFVLLLFFENAQAQSGKQMTKKDTVKVNKYEAILSGKNVIPPVKTKATGKATFMFSKTGKILYYNLTVNNTNNVIMAHIHHAAPGKDGPIAVWLYKGKPKGMVNGILSKGKLTNKQVNLDSLRTWINDGDTYVLIHTKEYPNGEIRGTIKPVK